VFRGVCGCAAVRDEPLDGRFTMGVTGHGPDYMRRPADGGQAGSRMKNLTPQT
jgi:hypothetical protein